ncbi:M23 family metallopeptidase [Corynebacterium doosanense]|uniref:Peptidase M23 n=1 Tax=Corynebacterium doosanense CAU 212 = DSM 45436 TaxID=558173 RepID=A0A097IGY6_9CORY|nr:M23 family metallopeptidase [Corynebacterium doosanense]AIT61362.1 peptidase M23 [Corynebacterium doosanense CAU 212 = DSM 45436]
MKRLLAVVLACVSTLPPPLALAYVSPATGAASVGRVLVPAAIPERNWQPGHRGVDLALATGSEVRAASTGHVAFAGNVAGTPSVSVEHPDGIRTTYTPVFARVREGDEVTEGQVIGTLAPPGPGHAGLHWGALSGRDVYLNPLTLLDAPVIRLKPVDAPGRTRP